MKKFFSLFAVCFLVFAFGCKHEAKGVGETNGDIIIKDVTVGGKACAENATADVSGTEANVVVTFAESYDGLSVKIGEKPATIVGKVASGKIDGITETAKAFKIEAKATGKNDKVFNFSVKKVLPIASIQELTFEGKEINPTATGYGAKDRKTYYSSKAPLLSEIASDGSTKVGDVREPSINITIKYNTGATEQKLKVENTTKGITREDAQNNVYSRSIVVGIGLKLGENNIIITYSEKGKSPLVYKVVVGYANPDYAPVSLIKIANQYYNSKEKLATLEAGTESIQVEGVPIADIKITMPRTWYEEDGWTLTLDGQNVEKTEFKKGGFGIVTYNVEKKVDLVKNGSKEIKIVIENPSYSTKTYKATVNHVSVNKITSVISIDAKSTEHVDTSSTANYLFDLTKKYYKAKQKISFKDRMTKGTFLVSPEDATIVPKYAFSDTEVDISAISTWHATTKKKITYIYYNNPTELETYVIENHELKQDGEFLYVLLENGDTKTYYVNEIVKEKVANNNAEKEKEEKIYKKENGDQVALASPVAKKGTIRVLPKSPRATVKLTAPKVEDFVLNTNDGYYECTIELPTQETKFSYKIVAEDTTTEAIYEGSFIKSILIRGFRFDYKTDGLSWQRGYVKEWDGNYYLTFDKKAVTDGKLYVFVTAFKGLGIECSDFAESTKKDEYTSTDYTIVLNVASLVSGTDEKKEYVANLTLEGESLPQLHLTVFPKDDIVKEMLISGLGCIELPENKYAFKANLNEKPMKVAVSLNLVDNETPSSTTRKIKILNGAEEKTVTINQKETSVLQFVHDGLTIGDKQKITLKIEYYAKNDDPSPTKTYTLEIEDI